MARQSGAASRTVLRVTHQPQRWAGQQGVRCSATPAGLVPCKIAGVGSSAPQKVLTNVDLSKYVDTNDEWITTRTGIKRRHVLAEGENLTTHAAAAAKRALEMSGIPPESIDLVLMATSTPDDVFGNACSVQSAVGATNAVAFDLTAACSGFVLALVTASQYVRTGTFKNVLVIGGDAMSRFVDWRDRGTCILFGDACGAVVVTANPGGACALLGMDMHSDGNGGKNLSCTYSGAGLKPESSTASAHGSYQNVTMQGQEVFKFAVRSVPTVSPAPDRTEFRKL